MKLKATNYLALEEDYGRMVKAMRWAIALVVAGLFCLGMSVVTASAQGQPSTNPQYPPGALAITASSGNVPAGVATATLGTSPGHLTYICGFALTASGATGASVVNPTVAGVIGGTQTYVFAAVAGATLIDSPLVVNFSPCVPATSQSTSIVVTLPSLGAGNTNAAAVAWGYQF